MVAAGTKTCSKCKAEKNLDAFSTNRAMKDGKNIYCRSCLSAVHKARRMELSRRPRTPADEKKCGRCGEVKPAIAYARNRCSTTGLQSSCKECMRKAGEERARSGATPPAEQACSACRKTLPSSHFHRNRLLSTLLAPACKDCARRRTRAAKYGIGDDWLNRIDQTDNCEICESKIFGPQKHFDHDHKTGLPRGVLCSRCNTMLGLASDDVDLLLSARAYLLKFRFTQGVLNRAS